ncbi:MAG: sulfur reduction protein DsrE [Desulfobulbaceae bacterium]|nr:sulfur reduction protein DsrE [Desulfobulbaceae bacterium]
MQVTMIITQAVPEVIWNAFRLANMMLEGMEEVSIFLNGPSVRYETMDSDQFPIKDLAKVFTLSEGQLYA